MAWEWLFWEPSLLGTVPVCVYRKTRPVGSASECFVLRPFLMVHFSFFSLNTHPLLPLLVMISRTLGPEVGGSIGLMFYLANVCGCAVSLLGLVEAVLDVFGTGLCSWHLCGFAGSSILGS